MKKGTKLPKDNVPSREAGSFWYPRISPLVRAGATQKKAGWENRLESQALGAGGCNSKWIVRMQFEHCTLWVERFLPSTHLLQVAISARRIIPIDRLKRLR
ncbi:hypothetical protein PDE_07831 [Penicillium oxalicum 114-2]|uniref:Uncharacterized protein n=1 Tax=Penicillium oxalicum (strain 114-2 / CGMCC 5302) TaxID=933388 RepID=S7ZQ79_PENO1|nr:hypothetical protein PDE_07831 [Penicillium oxalicum 114-2]